MIVGRVVCDVYAVESFLPYSEWDRDGGGTGHGARVAIILTREEEDGG